MIPLTMRFATRHAPAIAAAALLAWPALAGAQLLAAGDPGPDRAVLWTRVDQPGGYRFEVSAEAHFASPLARPAFRASEAGGLTAQVAVKGLQPATRYYYRVLDAAGRPQGERASFVTAPRPGDAQSVKILFGADLGGQGFGRYRPGSGLKLEGWPIFEPMRAEGADFFLALGDMIYSDRPITAEAPDKAHRKGNDFQVPKPGPGHVATLEDFRRDWLYHRDEPLFAKFLRDTSLVATWDDHEIVNDSGGPELRDGPSADELARDGRLRQGDPSRPRGEFMPWSTTKDPQGRRKSVFHNPGLYRAARQAMFEWNPVAVLPDPSGREARRLYRSLRWGAHAEVFVLDTRSYRDPRYREDRADRPKTMLGEHQRRWLLDGLAASDATWKIVVSTVPLSIEGGNERDPKGRYYRDAWSPVQADNPYGFGRELGAIAGFIREKGVRNVLFLTGDQHFSNLIAYDPDGDGRPDFHEANIGPLRAGVSAGDEALDPALRPTRLFTDAGKAAHSYGAVAIDGQSGRLAVTFHDARGEALPGARLVLDPEKIR